MKRKRNPANIVSKNTCLALTLTLPFLPLLCLSALEEHC